MTHPVPSFSANDLKICIIGTDMKREKKFLFPAEWEKGTQVGPRTFRSLQDKEKFYENSAPSHGKGRC